MGGSNIQVTPISREMIQFDEHMFQRGRFNHQLVLDLGKDPFLEELAGEILRNITCSVIISITKSLRNQRMAEKDCVGGYDAYIF